MKTASRLNVLLTRPARPAPVRADAARRPDWQDLVCQLLAPLQVQTFVATSGSDAIDLVERHVLHLAVVDAQLPPGNQPAMDAMTVLRLIHRLSRPVPGGTIAGNGAVAEGLGPAESGQARSIPVSGLTGTQNLRQGGFSGGPLVILLVRQTEDRLIREALRQDVFSVLPDPLQVNDLLDVMARALRRCYGEGWPKQ